MYRILLSILLFIFFACFSCTSSPFSKGQSQEINIINSKDGVKLAGTFSLPKGSGKFPAVLLIAGSGNHNRDEECFGHRPFYVLANYLVDNGIAVLRMDKRGCGKSGGIYRFGDIENFTEDAFVALEFLRSQDQTYQNKIGLLGHSQGGLIAPIMAAQDDKIGFIILLAGPGLWGKDFFYLQTKRIAELSTQKQINSKQLAKLYDKIWPILTKESTSRNDEVEGKKILWDIWQFMDPANRKMLGHTDENLHFFFSMYRSTPVRQFLNYDPQISLSRVGCPVLALLGDKDVQVSSKENLAAISDALKLAGNMDYEIVEFEGLNHLFQNCSTGSIVEYSLIRETISPVVLKKISSWINGL